MDTRPDELTDLEIERLIKARIWAQGEIARARQADDIGRIVELELLREEAAEMLEGVSKERQDKAMGVYLRRLQETRKEQLQ